ncbi:MAG: M28 family metallopeptidase [Armatimonadota bacterium]
MRPRRDFALLERISAARIEGDIRHLTSAWPTRHTESRHHDAVARWIAEGFARSGLRTELPVWSHMVARPVPGRLARRNVVAELAAKRHGAPITVVCAHFDSRQQDLRQAEAPAPGADDNATGVAILLECARVLATHEEPARDTVRFVCFSGEEQGLLGSTAYASEPANRRGVRFVFNIDQIGWPPPDRALYVDRDEGGNRANNARSAELVAAVQRLAAEVVKVPTRVDPAADSDYIAFERHGIPILGLYEAGKRYPHYHRDTDTFERVDLAYVVDAARLTLASVLELAREAA